MRTVFYLFLALLIAACNPSGPADGYEDSSEYSLDDLSEKTTITFPSKDSLLITADVYPNKGARKLILLFHQARFSRGEYVDIAPKLVEKGYACMAVDLRSGREANEVVNETFNRALTKGLSTNYQDARIDMQAAIAYAKEHSIKEIVLWGSSYSATLALIEGKEDPKVVKVVAFSPGVYFGNPETVKQQVIGYTKPVFVSCTANEVKVLSDIITLLPGEYTTKVENAGDHGSKSLWTEKPGSDSLFLKVVQFL